MILTDRSDSGEILTDRSDSGEKTPSPVENWLTGVTPVKIQEATGSLRQGCCLCIMFSYIDQNAQQNHNQKTLLCVVSTGSDTKFWVTFVRGHDKILGLQSGCYTGSDKNFL